MPCPQSASIATREPSQPTAVGYGTFPGTACRHRVNECTGTPFNCLEYPTAIVLLVALWRLQYTQSRLDLARLSLERGFVFTLEAVRDREARFAPVLTGGHTSYPRAIRETLGEEVEDRCNRHLNNRLEQDHRGIKQQYYPMRGFGSFTVASHFCSAHDELRDHFRPRLRHGETVPLAEQRRIFIERLAAVRALLAA